MSKQSRVRQFVAIVLMAVMVGSIFAALGPAFAASGDAGHAAVVAASASPAALPALTAAQTAAINAENAAITANTATDQALELAAERGGAKPNLIHLPTTLPSGYVDGKLVPAAEYYEDVEAVSPLSTIPAPAGIAYYGQSGSDVTASKVLTIVDTSSLKATLNVTNLSTLYLDTDNPDQVGTQLNAILTNTSINNAKSDNFWAQNVASYQTLNDTLDLVDNTWNFTTSTSNTFPTSGTSTIVASDSSDFNDGGELYIGQGPYLYAPMPFDLTLYLNSSLQNPFICTPESSVYTTANCGNPVTGAANYTGDQTLFYNYTFVDAKTSVDTSGTFDWLTFHTGPESSVFDPTNTRISGFEASGYKAGKAGLDADWELDFGIGAYDGANQDDFNGSGTAGLNFLADCTTPTSSVPSTCTQPVSPVYKPVPAALNAGSETGEEAVGISVDFAAKGIADWSTGPLNLHPLWGYGNQTGVTAGVTKVTNNVQVSGSPLTLTAQPYIFIFLEDTSITTPTDSYQWAPDTSAWYLMPGTYNYEAMLSDYTEQTGSITVGATPVTLTATLPYATSNGVYTPLWALNNAQLAGISTSGSGTIGSQFLIFNNNDTATSQALNAAFNTKDDYDFPSFTGLLLWNTTAYVNAHTMPYFYTGTSGLYLQQELYQTQHVTISNAGSITSWKDMEYLVGTPGAQNVIPQGDLMIWDSSNDLIYHNSFVAIAAGSSSFVSPALLVMFGGSNNVIWGNTFKDPSGSPSTPGTYAGLGIQSNGSLIYNNYFDVDNPVLFAPWNYYTEEGPWPASTDTWNITEQAATNVAETVNGFALSGNIIGSGQPFQGGNEWWNYPSTLNPVTTTPYTNVVDYTDYASYFPPGSVADNPGIGVGGDYVPLPGFTLTFTESGLPSGTTWHTTVLGVTDTSTSTTNSYTETPNGAYGYTIGTVAGYYATPSAGTATVHGAALNVPITFTKVLVASLSPNSATTQVGESVTFSVGFTGGAAPITWTLQATGSSSNLSNEKFTAAVPGIYTIYLNATDHVGQTANLQATVTVEPALVATLSATPTTTQVGASVALTVGFTGGVAPVTWTLQASGSSANLSGETFSPSSAGTYTIYLNATDAVGSHSDSTAVVLVEPALVATLSPATTTTQVGASVAFTVGITGGVTPVTWSLQASGSLANLSASTFTPGSAGTYTIYLNATDAVGSVSDATATVVVEPALQVSLTPGTATTQVGGPVAFTVGLNFGVGPYTWTLEASGSSANLSGETFTPSAAGIYSIYLNATDAVGSTAYATATVTVEPALAASLTPGTVTTQVGGSVSYSVGFTGGVLPVTWTLEASGSSANLSAGTFTPSSSGTYTIYLNATDAVGSTAFATATVFVQPALAATLSPGTSTTQVGASVVYSVGFTGGVAPVSWTLEASGSSANLSSSTFTPSAAGTYTVYLNATDAVGSLAYATATLLVEPALAATLSPGTAATQVGASVVFSVGLTGGVSPVTWTLEASGSLANLSASTFTPSEAGTYTIYLNATDAVGSTSYATATITVEPALAATLSPERATTQVGESVTFSVGFTGGVTPVTWTLEASGSLANLSNEKFTPVAAGTYTIYLNATDAVGSISDMVATVTVEPALVATLSISPSSATTQVGESVTFGVHFSGGVTPVSWTLEASGSLTNLSDEKFTPASPGTYTIYLNATDAVGSVSRVTATVLVEPALVATLTPGTSSVLVGGSVTFSVHLSGGVDPVTWTLEASGSLTNLSGEKFTPLSAGTYTIYLNATDAVGSVSRATATVEAAGMYAVTFTDHGLPHGKAWSVAFDGVRQSTTGTSLSFSVLDGTYTYLVAGPSGYRVTGLAPYGSITVNGAAVSETVTFVAGATYTLTFHEVGLGSGTSWCVTVGSKVCSTTANVAFKNLTPGTYSYAIGSFGGMTALVKVGSSWVVQSSGSVTVSRSATIQVRFAYAATFTESGLTGAFTWSVTSDGQTGTSSTHTIVLYLTNGTHGFSVPAVSGYLRAPASGRLTVSGAPMSQAIVFTLRGHEPAGAPGPTTGLLREVELAIEVALRL